MLKVISREYKVLLDHRLFADRKKAAADFWEELAARADTLAGVESHGEFNKTKKRRIVFLDTSDETILLNGLVFRQRADLEDGGVQYTLKCRSPDRYVAAGAKIRAAKKAKSNRKFEEDIGAPFVCRFSHSCTVDGPEAAPETLEQASELFSALGELERDGELCASSVKLKPTSSVTAFERVLTGPAVTLGSVEAEIALILWSDGPDGRPLIAEFSFRYGREAEDHSTEAARLAMRFFLDLQRLDWCLPEGRTKTQYVYGEH